MGITKWEEHTTIFPCGLEQPLRVLATLPRHNLQANVAPFCRTHTLLVCDHDQIFKRTFGAHTTRAGNYPSDLNSTSGLRALTKNVLLYHYVPAELWPSPDSPPTADSVYGPFATAL
jgi:hypothetical protein